MIVLNDASGGGCRRGNTLAAPYFKNNDNSLKTFDFAVANRRKQLGNFVFTEYLLHVRQPLLDNKIGEIDPRITDHQREYAGHWREEHL